MSDPRICIIGAGSLSTRRIYPNLGAAGAQLVGVCDVDREKAERNARRFGGAVYDDMERMLDDLRPDGAILCIGPEQHAALAPAVLERGIPLYTEKPPSATAADALAVARLSHRLGVPCTTAFKKRYNEAYNRARDWIARFPPEDLLALSIDYASAHYTNESLRRNFLHDFGVHIIDLTRYLFGDVEQVFAFTRDQHAYAISLRFASGAVGSLSFSDGRSFTVPTEEVEITAAGGNFMTIHNSSSWRITENGKPCEWREPPTFVSAGDSGNDTGHLAELVEFVNSLPERRRTRSDIYESYKSMLLYEAIAHSSATSRVVNVVNEEL